MADNEIVGQPVAEPSIDVVSEPIPQEFGPEPTASGNEDSFEPVAETGPKLRTLAESECATWYKDNYETNPDGPHHKSCDAMEDLQCNELEFVVGMILSAGKKPGSLGNELLARCPDLENPYFHSDQSCADLTISALQSANFGSDERQKNIFLTKQNCLDDPLSRDIDGTKFKCDGLKRARESIKNDGVPSFQYLVPQFQQALTDLGPDVYNEAGDECIPPPPPPPPPTSEEEATGTGSGTSSGTGSTLALSVVEGTGTSSGTGTRAGEPTDEDDDEDKDEGGIAGWGWGLIGGAIFVVCVLLILLFLFFRGRGAEGGVKEKIKEGASKTKKDVGNKVEEIKKKRANKKAAKANANKE